VSLNKDVIENNRLRERRSTEFRNEFCASSYFLRISDSEVFFIAGLFGSYIFFATKINNPTQTQTNIGEWINPLADTYSYPENLFFHIFCSSTSINEQNRSGYA